MTAAAGLGATLAVFGVVSAIGLGAVLGFAGATLGGFASAGATLAGFAGVMLAAFAGATLGGLEVAAARALGTTLGGFCVVSAIGTGVALGDLAATSATSADNEDGAGAPTIGRYGATAGGAALAAFGAMVAAGAMLAGIGSSSHPPSSSVSSSNPSAFCPLTECGAAPLAMSMEYPQPSRRWQV